MQFCLLVKPTDWPEGKNWGTLTIDASCTPADISYPTDLKLVNEARESPELIIDDLCDQHSDLRKLRPRYDHGRARAISPNAIAEGCCEAITEEESPQNTGCDTSAARLSAQKS